MAESQRGQGNNSGQDQDRNFTRANSPGKSQDAKSMGKGGQPTGRDETNEGIGKVGNTGTGPGGTNDGPGKSDNRG
jgi:hypothetical protein